MRDVKRQAVYADYMAAKKAGDHDRITEILLFAIEFDAAAAPGETRLMDVLRAAGADVKAVA